MKKIALAIAITSVLSTTAYADVYDFSASFTLDSNQAVGSGTEVYPGLFGKTLLTMNMPNGFFGEFWFGTGLEEDRGEGVERGVNEIDYTLGYGHETESGVSMTYRVDWYDVGGPDNLGFSDVTGDILHPVIEARYSLTRDGQTYVFGALEYFFVMGESDSDGYLGYVGIGHDDAWGHVGVSNSIRFGYEDAFNADRGYIRYDLSSSYDLGDGWSITGPGLKYTWNEDEPTKTWTFVGINRNF